MTITIGRRNTKRPFTPSNKGMADRVNRQLEAHAMSQAQKYSEALKVDAPQFVFWHNTKGSLPCSCTTKPANTKYANITPGEAAEETTGRLGHASGRKGKVSRHEPLGKPIGGIDSLFDPPLPKQETLLDKMTGGESYFKEGEFTDEDSITAAFSRDDGTVSDLDGDSLEDPTDPFGLYNRKMITCSICMGSGTIDAWQPNAGVRIVLDTSNAYNFLPKGVDVDDSYNPTRIKMPAESACAWLVSFPTIWYAATRIAVYNNDELIPAEWYEFTWATADKTKIGEVSETDIERLQGYDGDTHIVLLAKTAFDITHVEFIFLYAEPMRAQLPEVQQAYEDEFADWQQSLTVELPVGLDVVEGDYLAESKYGRIWKINSINRRITAKGNEFGVSAEIRALHSFERRFFQLSMFRNRATGRIKTVKNF